MKELIEQNNDKDQASEASLVEEKNKGRLGPIKDNINSNIGRARKAGAGLLEKLNNEMHDWHSDIKSLAEKNQQNLRALKENPSKENLEIAKTTIREVEEIMQKRGIKPENINLPQEMVDPELMRKRANDIYAREKIAKAFTKIADGYGMFDRQNKS